VELSGYFHMSTGTPPSLAKTIQQGSVYYFDDKTLSSPDPHYFIVINKNPSKEDPILLVCASSKVKEVEKSRSLWRAKTVVKISKTEYIGFTLDSIVDCNFILEKSKKELEGKLKDGRLKVKPVISKSIVDKLVNAVLESDVVEKYIKDKVC
jgi:hypothetical protein